MPVRRFAMWLCILASAASPAAVMRAQSSAPQDGNIPQFRSGITLLRFDASVVDDSGRAVGDLSAADFQVRIDGQARTVVAARFTGGASTVDAARATPTAPPSYVVNSAPSRGRAIAVVVDLFSIRAGGEAPLLETAAKLVEGLRPSDAIAVVPIPGSSVDLTRDHARAAQHVRTLRGTSDVPTFRHYFTLEEAIAFEHKDTRVTAEVIERECARDVEVAHSRRTGGKDENGAPLAPPLCPTDLERETRERLTYERRHVQTVLAALVSLAAQLRKVDAAASLIVVSGGLPFEQESLAQFQQLENALKAAAVGVYSVQVDQREVDASAMRPAKSSLYSSRDRETGLANLATMVGGQFFAGVGRAQGVFERMRTEITEAYELAVEAGPVDLDGKPHEVQVTTSRKATVHARRYVAAGTAPSDPAARLAHLLSQPVDVGDLPIAIAAHSVRGDEATTLKVMIRADIGHGVTTTAPIRYSAVVLAANDAVATDVTGTASAEGAVVVTTQLTPGRYRVRLAALDGSGRGGTLEVPIVAGLRSAGGLQLADLIVGTPLGQSLTPSIYAAAGQPLIPTLELTSADAARFEHTSVGFEVRRAGSDDVAATAAGRLEQTAYDRQQIARGSVTTANLSPGEYTVSAIVNVDGQPAGRVSRAFVIEPGASTLPTPAAVPSPAPPQPDAPAPARIADPVLDGVMHKVATYVANYGEQLSAVVAVEQYTQYVNPVNASPLRPVHLVAEFALVKSGGVVPWTGYRDVIEVNGESIHDRRDRIVKILEESNNPLEEAARLTAESARFNIGPVSRNFNVPTTALFFFNERNLGRFTFTSRGTKKIDGIDTLEIAFKEATRPTLITTRAGRDVPCDGLLWVVAASGAIVRTRLQVRGFSDVLMTADNGMPTMRSTGQSSAIPSSGVVQPSSPAPAPTPAPTPAPSPSTGGATSSPAGSGSSGSGGASGGARGSSAGDPNSNVGRATAIASFPELAPTQLGSTADIEVTYRRDEKLGIWLPAQMTEEYQGAIPRLNRPALPALTRSKATYSDYKQFGTSSTVIGVKK